MQILHTPRHGYGGCHPQTRLWVPGRRTATYNLRPQCACLLIVLPIDTKQESLFNRLNRGKPGGVGVNGSRAARFQ